MAEVHYMGQIVGASGFGRTGLLCKWGIEAEEDTWDALEGYQRGQTQTDYPRDDEMAVWAHPIDIHFQCLGLSGWPKLHFQVWSVDADGRTDIAGYGFTNLPTAPGVYQLECPLWVPEGTVGAYTSSEHRECPVVLTPRGHGQVYTLGALQTYGVTDSCSSAHERDAETCQEWPREKVLLNAGEKMSAFFIGGNPRLKNERVIFTGNDRYRLNTTCSGSVHLQISCMSKDFAENGVNCG